MDENNVLYKSNKPSNTIYDKALEYIDSKYSLRFNSIALDYEITLRNKENWSTLNLNSLLIELIKTGIDIPVSKLEILIKSDWIRYYNPVEEYFKNLKKWDEKTDFIKKLASYVNTNDNDAFCYHLEKWFVRAVLCALEKDKINKHCIVLANGDQHCGKSTYLRSFIPPKLSGFISEDIGIDKDSRIKLCTNLVINLDELSLLGKSDINSLKAFFSKTTVNERLPYERKSQLLNRICSFVGSSNLTDFLTDETGNVRWIVFDVKGRIDFNYSKEIDIDDVWSQAYFLAYEKKNYNPELTLKDIEENEIRNERYTSLSIEQEMVVTYYEKSELQSDFRTATDIVKELYPLGLKMNREKIGRALAGFKFTRLKNSKRQVYGYLAKPKFKDSPFNYNIEN
ncbi:VapE domain-containing protein [Flavobacterium sp. J27]|uniref:VapE domain-containing protein n=1 Tax=Flavobacterium sp. J27 TaxID=2060419 RepID=UPI00102FAD93|nr:VapE domain-containing protein [Flavobacterium sp. J27]